MGYRAFRPPSGNAYLILTFAFADGSGSERLLVWPATLGIVCQTFDRANNLLETLNFKTYFSLLKRKTPTLRRLILPPATHPLAVYQAHIERAELRTTEGGIGPLSHDTLDEFVARQNMIGEHQFEVYHAQPYSWRDHLRWYLQLDAPKPDKSG